MKRKVKSIYSAFSEKLANSNIFSMDRGVNGRRQLLYRPDESQLKKWATSEWIEYQAWIFNKEYLTLDTWDKLRARALEMVEPPLISVLIPTYNTDPAMLAECIYSVQSQVYHNWEICIADDGSTSQPTLDMLKQFADEDPRIKVSFSTENHGICHGTNRALSIASGEYVAFLDHDDRLAPNALFCVADAICLNREIGVVYSDRDMISLNGRRFMHLFKPDFSPELLFSMNYICHLMVYKKDLVDQVGGIHSEFEGSQDYDLILRVMELNPVVHHIPKVLYHWRQSEFSVALNHDAKNYAYKAGVKALKHALKRRGLQGDVNELSDLWRGHYRVRLTPPEKQSIALFEIDAELPVDSYVEYIEESIASVKDQEIIIFKNSNLTDVPENGEEPPDMELASWFQIPDVGLVTAKIVNEKGRLVHAGLVQRNDKDPFSIYEGFPEDEPGYIASTMVVRNVSAPHPFCFAVRRSMWENMGGFNRDFKGPHAILDFANRAGRSGSRVVYTPYAQYSCPDDSEMSPWIKSDAELYFDKWSEMLSQGEPFYNRHLILRLVDMGLDCSDWGGDLSV